MEIRLYGVLCDHENRQAIITKENAQKLYRLVCETKEKRDKRAEIECNYLHDLETNRSSGNLSDDEQRICHVWYNLNYAIIEMKATFCDEFQRNALRFSVGAERSSYNFLMALAEFDALYPAEI